MTKQPLTRINYNIPMSLYERERRGYPAEAGFAGHLTKPIDLRRREAMSRQVAS
jgi:hypothetical protein